MINAEKEILDEILEQIVDINTSNGFENNLEAVYPGLKEYESYVRRKNYLICFVIPDRKGFERVTESRLNKKDINFMIIFRWSGDVDVTTSSIITEKEMSIAYDFERWFNYALNLQSVEGYQRSYLIEGSPNIFYKENAIELFYRVNIEVIQ